MFPTLLAIGPIIISSLNVMLVIALLVGLFVFWRKGKEEHYDEMELFDGVFLGQAMGIVAARIGFIALHFERFGLNPIAWLDVFSNPGFNLGIFFAISGFYLFRYAQKKKWDAFEIMDFWVLGVAVSMILVWLGYFLAGVGFGTPTALPIGLVFPGVFEKHHPVQLYFMIFYVLLAWYLGWVEYRYRTFGWYRKSKNTAQTGFLFAVFLIASGFIHSVLSLVTVSSWSLYGVRIDVVLAVLMLIYGMGLLYVRSGRTFFSFRKNARAKKLEQFKV